VFRVPTDTMTIMTETTLIFHNFYR
jgi:hypothetical protein